MHRSQPSQSNVRPSGGSRFPGFRRVHEIAHKVVGSLRIQTDSHSASKIRQRGISSPLETMQPTRVPPAAPLPLAPAIRIVAPPHHPPTTQPQTLNRAQPLASINHLRPGPHNAAMRPDTMATYVTGTTISFASAPRSDTSMIAEPPSTIRADSSLSWDDTFLPGPKAAEARAQPEVYRFDERGLHPLHFPPQRQPSNPAQTSAYPEASRAAVAAASRQPVSSAAPPMQRARAVTGASRPLLPVLNEPRRKVSSFSSSISSAEIHLAERVPVARLAPAAPPRVVRASQLDRAMVMQQVADRGAETRVVQGPIMGSRGAPQRGLQRSESARQPPVANGGPPRRVLQNWNGAVAPGTKCMPSAPMHRRAGTIDTVLMGRNKPAPQLYQAWHDPQWQRMTTDSSNMSLAYFPNSR